MCVQQRFGDAARKETDNDIPDEMKHILPFESCDLEDGPQHYQRGLSEAMQKFNVVPDRFL